MHGRFAMGPLPVYTTCLLSVIATILLVSLAHEQQQPEQRNSVDLDVSQLKIGG